MLPSIVNAWRRLTGRGGFSLIEMLVSVAVVIFVFLAAVSIYMMAWQWWAETAPRVEVQKVARVAVASIIEGRIDGTAGTYTVGSTTYGRRNGIAWAAATPDIPSLSRINFMLNKPGETTNCRAFYMGYDSSSGSYGVYYLDSNNVTHLIKPTLGITELEFEFFKKDGEAEPYNNIIKVTATAEMPVTGTRRNPYQVTAEFTDYVYLRNVVSL